MLSLSGAADHNSNCTLFSWLSPERCFHLRSSCLSSGIVTLANLAPAGWLRDCSGHGALNNPDLAGVLKLGGFGLV